MGFRVKTSTPNNQASRGQKDRHKWSSLGQVNYPRLADFFKNFFTVITPLTVEEQSVKVKVNHTMSNSIKDSTIALHSFFFFFMKLGL